MQDSKFHQSKNTDRQAEWVWLIQKFHTFVSLVGLPVMFVPLFQ